MSSKKNQVSFHYFMTSPKPAWSPEAKELLDKLSKGPNSVVTHEALVLAAKKALRASLVTYLEASLQATEFPGPSSGLGGTAEDLVAEMDMVTCLVEDLGYDLDMALYVVETAGVRQLAKFFSQLPLLEVPAKQALEEWRKEQATKIKGLSLTSLPKAVMSVPEVEAQFSDTPKVVSLDVTEKMKESDPDLHELGQQLKIAISTFEEATSKKGIHFEGFNLELHKISKYPFLGILQSISI